MRPLIGLVKILQLNRSLFSMKNKKKKEEKELPKKEEPKITYTSWIIHDRVNQLWEWDTLKTVKL